MPFQVLGGAKTPIKVFVDDLSKVESAALDQLRGTANLPWVKGVAAMPDVHFGLGATVGSVVLSEGAVSPSVVGVDIGCGMMAVKTPYKEGHLKDLASLRHSIERSVPVGFNANKEITPRVKGLYSFLGRPSELADKLSDKALSQLGTLGGGNHFIEICLDKEGNVWVMLHSGSRNLGKTLAEHHINVAKGLMAEQIQEKKFNAELAALMVGTADYGAYLFDLRFAQAYAMVNREEMMFRVLKDLAYHVEGKFLPPHLMGWESAINCHHNYIEETPTGALLTRKGAVSARKGQLGIIPGSMGARSFIVRGRGSADSFCSCSHGAGRRMSRGAAKRTFTVDDLREQTKGVECRKDEGVIDEIPGAYKDIAEVMANQSDLVDIVAELRQVVCVKG